METCVAVSDSNTFDNANNPSSTGHHRRRRRSLSVKRPPRTARPSPLPEALIRLLDPPWCGQRRRDPSGQEVRPYVELIFILCRCPFDSNFSTPNTDLLDGRIRTWLGEDSHICTYLMDNGRSLAFVRLLLVHSSASSTFPPLLFHFLLLFTLLTSPLTRPSLTATPPPVQRSTGAPVEACKTSSILSGPAGTRHFSER